MAGIILTPAGIYIVHQPEASPCINWLYSSSLRLRLRNHFLGRSRHQPCKEDPLTRDFSSLSLLSQFKTHLPFRANNTLWGRSMRVSKAAYGLVTKESSFNWKPIIAELQKTHGLGTANFNSHLQTVYAGHRKKSMYSSLLPLLNANVNTVGEKTVYYWNRYLIVRGDFPSKSAHLESMVKQLSSQQGFKTIELMVDKLKQQQCLDSVDLSTLKAIFSSVKFSPHPNESVLSFYEAFESSPHIKDAEVWDVIFHSVDLREIEPLLRRLGDGVSDEMWLDLCMASNANLELYQKHLKRIVERDDQVFLAPRYIGGLIKALVMSVPKPSSKTKTEKTGMLPPNQRPKIERAFFVLKEYHSKLLKESNNRYATSRAFAQVVKLFLDGIVEARNLSIPKKKLVIEELDLFCKHQPDVALQCQVISALLKIEHPTEAIIRFRQVIKTAPKSAFPHIRSLSTEMCRSVIDKDWGPRVCKSISYLVVEMFLDLHKIDPKLVSPYVWRRILVHAAYGYSSKELKRLIVWLFENFGSHTDTLDKLFNSDTLSRLIRVGFIHPTLPSYSNEPYKPWELLEFYLTICAEKKIFVPVEKIKKDVKLGLRKIYFTPHHSLSAKWKRIKSVNSMSVEQTVEEFNRVIREYLEKAS